MTLPLDIRRMRLQLVRDQIDASGGGALHILAGAEPVNTTPLLIINLGPVSFEMHATDASMSLSVEGNVAISGVPTRARFVDGAGLVRMTLPAGLPGSGAPVIVSDGNVPPGNYMYIGGVVTVTGTIDEP